MRTRLFSRSSVQNSPSTAAGVPMLPRFTSWYRRFAVGVWPKRKNSSAQTLAIELARLRKRRLEPVDFGREAGVIGRDGSMGVGHGSENVFR